MPSTSTLSTNTNIHINSPPCQHTCQPCGVSHLQGGGVRSVEGCPRWPSSPLGRCPTTRAGKKNKNKKHYTHKITRWYLVRTGMHLFAHRQAFLFRLRIFPTRSFVFVCVQCSPGDVIVTTFSRAMLKSTTPRQTSSCHDVINGNA